MELEDMIAEWEEVVTGQDVNGRPEQGRGPGRAKTSRVRKWRVETVRANRYCGTKKGRDAFETAEESVRRGAKELVMWRRVAACDAVALASQNTSSPDPRS